MCEKCDGRGWIEGYFAGQGGFTRSLEQCPRRCNLSGYSKEVQRRLNNTNTYFDVVVENSRPAKVILFPTRVPVSRDPEKPA